MKTFKALLLREHREHRGVYIAPLVFCALILLAAAVALFVPGRLQTSIMHDQDGVIQFHNDSGRHLFEVNDISLRSLATLFENLPQQTQGVAINGMLHGVAGTLLPIALVLAIALAAQSLFRERKDRSVLFWRSMPVSDTQTVLSKLVYIVVVFPLLFLECIAVTQISLLLLYSIAGLFFGLNPMTIWGPAEVLLCWWDLAHLALALQIFYLPVIAYAMMMSALSRRNPLLMILLTPALLLLGERLIWGGDTLLNLLLRYVQQGPQLVMGTGMQMTGDSMTIRYGAPLAEVMNGGMLIGLLVAGVFIAAAIQIRRHSESA